MVDKIAQQGASAHERMVHLLFRQDGASESALHEALRSLRFTAEGPFVVLAHESTRTHDLSVCRGMLTAAGIVSVWTAEVDGARGLVQLGPGARTPVVESLIDVVGSSIGVSEAFDDFHRIGYASTQARQALRCAPVGTRTVIDATAVPLELLIVESRPVAAHLARGTLGELAQLPADERSVLLATLGAWFENDGSTAAAAQDLHYHRNTILNRLKRIENLTGRDLARPADVAALYVAWSTARLVDLGLDDPRIAG